MENPYSPPSEEIIRAELVKPKPSVGWRVIRSILIAFAIFLVGYTAFFYWLVWVFESTKR